MPGRNDPCPCGSGKKYKKCCLGKGRESGADAVVPKLQQQFPSAKPPADPLATLNAALTKVSSAPVKKPPAPPEPVDPITARGDARWKEFEGANGERRIAVFLEILDDAEIMTDEMAHEMLTTIHGDLAKLGTRNRFSELVRTLQERLPEIYEADAHQYFSLQLLDALADSRHDLVPTLAQDLAGLASRNLDTFGRSLDALEYHGQLGVLVNSVRTAWSEVNASKEDMGWGKSTLANIGGDLEIFTYLEEISSPDADDPLLLDRIKVFVKKPRKKYIRNFVSDLTGTSGSKWQVTDFAMKPPADKSANEWGDDDDEKQPPDQGALNLERLIDEFVGYYRRQENVPFPRGNMVRRRLRSYFMMRHAGELDPRPSMLDQMQRPNLKLPKPPQPVHPLCPERVTLEFYLARLVGVFSAQFHVSAAVFQAMPAWIRFLELRNLIDADIRSKVVKELLPLHAEMLKMWQDFEDDPTLARQEQSWPDDAARGPQITGV